MQTGSRRIKSLVRIGLLRIDYPEDVADDIMKEQRNALYNISSFHPILNHNLTNISAILIQNSEYITAACYKGHVFLGILNNNKYIQFTDHKCRIIDIPVYKIERLATRLRQYENKTYCQYSETTTIYQAWKQTEPYLERAVEEMDRFKILRDSSVTAISSDKFLEHDSILNHIALEYEAEMAIREYCKRNGITITSSYFDKAGAYYLNGEPFAYLQEDGRVKLFQAKTEWQRFFIKRELNFGFPAESVYYELRTLQALLPLFMEISPFTENEPTVIRLIESPLWKDPALAKEQFEKIQKFVQSSHTPVQEEELSQEIQNFFDKSL